MDNNCQRGCQRAQGWHFRPASCFSLPSSSGLQALSTYSIRSTVPGVGPECGRKVVAWVAEKELVISCKDLCGWCYSGGEGKAAGKSCQGRIMGGHGDLQIVVISRQEDFQTVGKGHALCVCVGERGSSFLLLQLGFWRSDMPCFSAGPWRVARETVGQLQRCSQRRVGDSGCLLRYCTPSPLHGKGSQRPFLLDPTQLILSILLFLDRQSLL